MFVAEKSLPAGQGLSNQCFRLFEFSLITVNGGQLVERRCYFGVLVTEDRAPDAESFLMCAFGFRQVAFLLKGNAEFVQGRCRLSALRSVASTVECQRCP